MPRPGRRLQRHRRTARRRVPYRAGPLTAPPPRIEDLPRDLAPQVLGAVVRRFGHFDTAEDATQEALLAAALQWPSHGVPVARAFLVPEPTMARRISRAKKTIKDSGVPFAMPADRAERLGAVLHTLYLIFNEG
ncbi:hypothetical protein GCM10027176_13080 [Actinoallomurus bryophytorum]|uniref:hypothetical protein n=1 Tax=Actinoallomurus bryophytorum TaxID=1490222 RepID=UPI001C89CDDB